MSRVEFLAELQAVIASRMTAAPSESYTARLAQQGIRKVAQKVGEEGVEIAIAAVSEDAERVTSEAADLLYHLLVLLELRGLNIGDVVAELERRHKPSS